MFARAIVLDSTYGRAFAGVADCCSFLYMYYESSDENLNEADTASRKAVELDAKLFEAHYFYARALYSQGKLEEAAQKSEDAYRVNPGDYQSPIFQAQTFLSLGRRAHASAGFRRAVETVRRHLTFNADDVRALYLGAGSLVGLGELEEAQQ